MRRTVLAVGVAVVAIIGLNSSPAAAQDKTARGTVTAMAGDSVTVKVQNTDTKFTVDAKTTVEAVGGSTQSRAAERAGQAGPKLSDVVKVGQAVEVTYREAAGKMTASKIRVTTASAIAAAESAPDKTSTGTVKTIAATSMTITGSGGGGATFTQTFAIDANTKVIGRGASTATASTGGKAVVTSLIGAGDTVTVSYKAAGTTLTAMEIRVTAKGSTK